MIIKNVKLFLALAIALTGTIIHAEDDLLKILEQSEAQKQTTNVVEHLKMKELRAAIGSDSGDTNIFLQRLFASDYQGALLTFKEAIRGTSFQKSVSAQALEGFLYFQNGLRLEGLEKLLSIEDVKTVTPVVLDFWRPVVKADSKEWKISKIKASDSWGAFFGLPSQASQVKMWKSATELAVKDQLDQAAKLLAVLAKEPDPYVDQNLIHLTASRLLYQKGYLEPSIRYTKMVPRTSDWWFTAQEEAAWAYMRKAEIGSALAITKSLMHEKLTRDVGPETVFLHSLLNLKVCNYPEVITALKAYKERYRPRVIELQKLVARDVSSEPALKKALSLSADARLRPIALGSESAKLPRVTGLDRQLQQDGLLVGVLTEQAAAAGKLYSASLEKGSQVGFQAEFEGLKKRLESQAHTAEAAFRARVIELARFEIEEISQLLQKMHIVEAEVIQQTGLSERIAKDTLDTKKPKIKFEKVEADQIRFAGTKEVWFDELNHYKVKVAQGCKGKTL